MKNIPEHIKSLVIKWRKGSLSETEKAELDTWYETPLPEFIYMEGNGLDQVKNKMLAQIKAQIAQPENKVAYLSRTWVKIAAAMLIIIGTALFSTNYFNRISEPGLALTVKSQSYIKRIILPDSSIVWLKKNSRISYPKIFGSRSRIVELHGEAFFEIAHNKQWPFKIVSSNYTTTVLGTSFNLKTGEGDRDFSITVLTGKVEVAQKGKLFEKSKYLVTANQVYSGTSQTVQPLLIKENKEQVRELLQGTQYDMSFTKIPFEKIMERFEEKFDVKFEGYTGEYNACVITADLTNLPFDKSLQLLCLSINATYKVEHNKITLTGGGCF